jgi:hypothetical protein
LIKLYEYYNDRSTQEKDGEVRDYFEKLGYDVSWDFNKRSGERWWEISNKNGKLIVQIDMDVPLSDIVEDICQFHQGKLGTSKSDYELSGPESDEMDKLWKEVYEERNKLKI